MCAPWPLLVYRADSHEAGEKETESEGETAHVPAWRKPDTDGRCYQDRHELQRNAGVGGGQQHIKQRGLLPVSFARSDRYRQPVLLWWKGAGVLRRVGAERRVCVVEVDGECPVIVRIDIEVATGAVTLVT